MPREWLKNFRESTLRSLERDHCVKLTFSKDNSNPDSKALKITGTVANQDDAKVAIKDLIQSSVESKLRADEERKEKEMRRSSIRSDRSESKRRGDDLGSPRSRMGSTSGGNLFPSFTEDDGAAPMELSGQDPPKSQWQQVMDENGRPYYWNVKTDEVKWETPEPEKVGFQTLAPHLATGYSLNKRRPRLTLVVRTFLLNIFFSCRYQLSQPRQMSSRRRRTSLRSSFPPVLRPSWRSKRYTVLLVL